MSITFDPERDTRERLLEFSGYYNADHNGWYFLRGEKQYTHDLAYDYGVMIQEKEDGTFAHSNIFFLIDKDGYRFANITLSILSIRCRRISSRI